MPRYLSCSQVSWIAGSREAASIPSAAAHTAPARVKKVKLRAPRVFRRLPQATRASATKLTAMIQSART